MYRRRTWKTGRACAHDCCSLANRQVATDVANERQQFEQAVRNRSDATRRAARAMSPIGRRMREMRFNRDHGGVKERCRASCLRGNWRRVVAIDQRADRALAATSDHMSGEGGSFTVGGARRFSVTGREKLVATLHRMPVAMGVTAELVDERVQPRAQTADAPDEGQQRERR